MLRPSPPSKKNSVAFILHIIGVSRNKDDFNIQINIGVRQFQNYWCYKQWLGGAMSKRNIFRRPLFEDLGAATHIGVSRQKDDFIQRHSGVIIQFQNCMVRRCFCKQE